MSAYARIFFLGKFFRSARKTVFFETILIVNIVFWYLVLYFVLLYFCFIILLTFDLILIFKLTFYFILIFKLTFDFILIFILTFDFVLIFFVATFFFFFFLLVFFINIFFFFFLINILFYFVFCHKYCYLLFLFLGGKLREAKAEAESAAEATRKDIEKLRGLHRKRVLRLEALLKEEGGNLADARREIGDDTNLR